MTLGAYSILRYSNTLNDQRLNLGVVVWHPIDGLGWRFSPSLDRVQAIEPRARTKPLRDQVNVIEGKLKQSDPGRETLETLSKWFCHGLEITDPYPARIHSLGESIDRFYALLVSPVEEIYRASSQKQFQSALKRTLEKAVHQIDRSGRCEDRGRHKVNGVSVDLGIYAAAGKQKSLWRALSLQSIERAEDQVAKAKATALDVQVIRTIPQYRRMSQFVVMLEPKPKASERFHESVAWVKREADGVIAVRAADGIMNAVISRLGRGR